MQQAEPLHPNVTAHVNPIILDYLRNTYGDINVCWPIVWLIGNQPQWYTFELTNHCNANLENGNRPNSISGLNRYFIDYTSNPRRIIPHNPQLIPSIAPEYTCSYDYMIEQGAGFGTVDINFVWRRDNQWHALDLTTFYRPFTNRTEAERIIGYLRRRPTWRFGVQAINSQIDAAQDLGCVRYIMGCVNTLSRNVSDRINTNGNAYWFPLNTNNVQNILNRRAPDNAIYGTFQDFLNDL